MKKGLCCLLIVIFAFVSLAYAATQVSNRIWKDTATGAVALATTVAPGVAWRLDSVRIHLSAAGAAGNLTATVDAAAGGEYDAVVWSQDMTSVSDLVWFPERDLIFTATDELDFAWANASTRTYGLEVYYTKLN